MTAVATHRPTADTAVTEPVPAVADRGAALRATLVGVAGDIGLPVGTYYALHALGVSDTVALLAGTVAAAARMAVGAIRSRRLTAFSALMFAVYAFGLALTFVNGDPHFLLVKDSFGTAVVGLGFLVSLVAGRPMVLETMKNVPTRQSEELVRRYATDAAVRRTVHVLTTLWGIGLLADAVVRVPVVCALPISVGVAVSHVLSIVVIAVLSLVSGLIVKRARRAATAA